MPIGQSADLPEHLTSFSPHWLLLELVFVALLVVGMVALWTLARNRLMDAEISFWARVAEAVIVVPWVLSPVLFAAALLEAFRPVLVATQVVLAVAGAAALITAGRRARSRGRERSPATSGGRWSLPPLVDLLALAAVGLFLLWSWLMPFPAATNGHHHVVMNLLSELWSSGGYPVLAETSVSYDTEIFVWPAPFALSLSLFSFPAIDAIDTRPLFLLPGLFALLTLQLLRLTTAKLSGHKSLGSLAFLLICFSYYAAGEFTQISFDLFSPLVLSYFGLHLARWITARECDWFALALTLAFTSLVRRQVFLLIAAIIIVVALLRLVRWRDLVQSLRTSSAGGSLFGLGLVVMPVLAWTLFTTLQYGDPFFPHSSRAGEFGLFHLDELLAGELSGHPLLLVQFLPVFADEGLSTLVKNLLLGLSFSIVLSVAIAGCLAVAGRIAARHQAYLLRRHLLAILIGFAIVLYVAFPDYAKFAHYAVYLLAPFAALFAAWLASRIAWPSLLSVVAAVLFAAGIAYWSYNSWGHALADTSFTNVRYLLPSYGEPLDRLARRANREPVELADEVAEYDRALASLGPGERILHLDHEPGALIPSLLEREFLGNALYLESSRGAPLLAADTATELREQLTVLGVRYVYRPGRAHRGIADSLVMQRLAASEGASQYVVPVRDLFTGSAG